MLNNKDFEDLIYKKTNKKVEDIYEINKKNIDNHKYDNDIEILRYIENDNNKNNNIKKRNNEIDKVIEKISGKNITDINILLFLKNLSGGTNKKYFNINYNKFNLSDNNYTTLFDVSISYNLANLLNDIFEIDYIKINSVNIKCYECNNKTYKMGYCYKHMITNKFILINKITSLANYNDEWESIYIILKKLLTLLRIKLKNLNNDINNTIFNNHNIIKIINKNIKDNNLINLLELDEYKKINHIHLNKYINSIKIYSFNTDIITNNKLSNKLIISHYNNIFKFANKISLFIKNRLDNNKKYFFGTPYEILYKYSSLYLSELHNNYTFDYGLLENIINSFNLRYMDFNKIIDYSFINNNIFLIFSLYGEIFNLKYNIYIPFAVIIKDLDNPITSNMDNNQFNKYIDIIKLFCLKNGISYLITLKEGSLKKIKKFLNYLTNSDYLYFIES